MKDTFLKIAGVKSEKDFYKKYPTEEAFFTEHPEAMQMKHGGAVDLNAFYNQPRFIQTNIMEDGGMYLDFLPEFQFAGPISPSVVMLENQQKIWQQNQEQWGTPPAGQTIKTNNNLGPAQTNFAGSPPVSAAPAFTPNYNVAYPVVDNKQSGNISAESVVNAATQPGFLPNMSASSITNPVKSISPESAVAAVGQYGIAPNKPASALMNTANISAESAVNAVGQYGILPNMTASSIANPVNNKQTVVSKSINKNQTPATTSATVATTGAVAGATAGTTSNTNATNIDGGKNAPAAPAAPVGNSQLRGADGKLLSAQQTIYARPLANKQLLNNKAYSFASDASMMPFMGTGMLDNDGLSGYLKAGLGLMSGVGGMMTGLDNVWRGFKGRKEDVPGAANTPTNYQPPMMQESPIQEMQRKKQQQINPSMFPPGMNFSPAPAGDYNNTAAYGGELYKAQNGFNYSLNPNVDPSKISIGQNQLGLDPVGLQRTLGANAGLSMFNEVVGMGQAKKQNRMAQVQQGMSDFAYQPDDSNSMAMGYDTLNTGPGQTQAPNLYTPVQYAGQQMASQYEEGGEYDWTPEQIHQFLAEGGEIEFV